jgi:hypothetical protein
MCRPCLPSTNDETTDADRRWVAAPPTVGARLHGTSGHAADRASRLTRIVTLGRRHGKARSASTRSSLRTDSRQAFDPDPLFTAITMDPSTHKGVPSPICA